MKGVLKEKIKKFFLSVISFLFLFLILKGVLWNFLISVAKKNLACYNTTRKKFFLEYDE